ncbi:MAG TPA: CCA tRNA nucleotidyltransferase [Actinomycetes bacterium]|nr:CCA tRNA nucleotidyltransferase [Actinomycetes bacterium]
MPNQSASLTEIQLRAIAELLRVAPVAVELGQRFAAGGYNLALVGGSVRDALLGKLGNDLDFATNARPGEIMSVVRPWADAVWDVGKAFGTIGARREDFQLEITTYRSEAYDRTSRKPVVAFGDSLEGDLERRDFAVNAMALTLPQPRFVDPYGGLADLSRKLLRTPASPESSFSDDPLRMMRAARFAAQLGFTIAPEARQAIVAMTDRLDIVSAERVRDELVKLICAPDPRAGLEILVETGLANRVLPELPRLRLEIDEHHRHKDVYEHTLTVLEQAITLEEPDQPPDFVLRFAALMHDVGKPKTRRLEADGRVSFHFHEVVGANLTRARMRALKFDRPTTEDVARLVELHLRFHGYGGGEWTDSAVRRYVRDAGPLLSRLHKLTRSDCTTRNRRKAEVLARTYDQLEARIAALQAQEELDAIRPDLDGDEIMQLLGLQPGPLVGRARKHMLELRLDAGPMDHEAAVAALMAWWWTQPESHPDHRAGGAGSAGS